MLLHHSSPSQKRSFSSSQKKKSTDSSNYSPSLPTFIFNGMVHAFVLSCFSHVQLFATHGLQPARLLCPRDSSGKNTGEGVHAFLQGNFLAQRLKSHVSYVSCIGRQVLYHEHHLGKSIPIRLLHPWASQSLHIAQLYASPF